MSERIKAWLSRDLTRDEFLRWMLFVYVFSALILGGATVLLGISTLFLRLGFLAFMLVWLWRLYVGFTGLESTRTQIGLVVALVIIVISVLAVQVGIPSDQVVWSLFFFVLLPILLYPIYRNRDWILGREQASKVIS